MQPFEAGAETHTAEPLLRAAAALPIAAVLGAVLALDPDGKIEVEWDEKKN